MPVDPTGSVPGGFHTEFVVTRSVRDAARALSAFHAPLRVDLRPEGGPRRIAVATQAAWIPAVDPAIAAATLRTARLCEQLGHTVEEAAPTIDWFPVFEAMKDLWALGTLDTVRAWADVSAAGCPADIEGLTWDLVNRARRLDSTDVRAALSTISSATDTFAAFFAEFDMLLTPTLPATAPLIGQFSPDMDSESYYRSPVGLMEPAVAVFNATGQPAISIPAGLADGLPVGVHIASGFHREAMLLALAAELEAEIQWPRWTPPVHAGRPRAENAVTSAAEGHHA